MQINKATINYIIGREEATEIAKCFSKENLISEEEYYKLKRNNHVKINKTTTQN